MKKQARMFAALAAFVFGAGATLGASAAGSACDQCWSDYYHCKNTPEYCDGRLNECLLRGDGKFPCPL